VFAGDRHNLPEKRRAKLEPKIKAAAKRCYRDFKVDRLTHLPTNPHSHGLQDHMVRWSLAERKRHLRKVADRRAEGEVVDALLERFETASRWLRRRVEARLLAMLPDAVVTVRDGAGIPQRLERAVLLDLTTKLRSSQAPGAAVLYDNPRSKMMTQPSRDRRREAMSKVQVLDIEANTITIRGIRWWAVSVTPPKSLVEGAARLQIPTYSISYSPDKVPDQFKEWAQKEHAARRIITQGNAYKAMCDALLGALPSEKTVRAWCRTLPST
jgi:hypothetical protein